MNFYPPVLERTGTFSTIWLVATKGRKVTRREILRVAVNTTCDNIMDYVLGRVLPPEPGLPRPRFSLYLSSQLQYGVVLVFHRQCALLLEDLQSFMFKMTRTGAVRMIDLADKKRPAVEIPDALLTLEKTMETSEPLFGLMQADVPCPSTLMQISEGFLAGRSQLDASSQETAHTSPREVITMRDMDPVVPPVHQFEGDDLTFDDPNIVDFLLSAEDFFTEEAGPLREEVTPRNMERSQDVTPATIQSSRDILSLLTDDLDPAKSLVPEEPRVSADSTAEPHISSSPAEPAAKKSKKNKAAGGAEEARRRRRRRQLVFWDPVTQLPSETMRQWMADPFSHTTKRLTPPLIRLVPAAQLLSTPCSAMPEALMEHWTQAQTVTPLPELELQIGPRDSESSGSDKGPEAQWEQRQDSDHREASQETSPPAALSSESPRPAAFLPIPEQPEEVLEEPAAEEATPTAPIPTSTVFLPIPEEPEEVLEELAAEEATLTAPVPLPGEREEVLFVSLLPPQCSRGRVSHIFLRLLKNVSAGRLCVRQDKPYGQITISP